MYQWSAGAQQFVQAQTFPVQFASGVTSFTFTYFGATSTGLVFTSFKNESPTRNTTLTQSPLYVFSSSFNRFVAAPATLSTQGPQDVEAFTSNGNLYLAIANYAREQTGTSPIALSFEINSLIYKWVPASNSFVQVHSPSGRKNIKETNKQKKKIEERR